MFAKFGVLLGITRIQMAIGVIWQLKASQPVTRTSQEMPGFSEI